MDADGTLKPDTGRPGEGPGSASGALLSPERLEAVRARNPEALGELFEAYFGKVYSLAYRLVGEKAGAEDVTQDVFLKVYNAAPTLDASRDPGPWLAAITYNACREVWRSKGRRLFKEARSLNGEPALGQTLANGRNGPEKRAMDREREAQIMKAIMQLSREERSVVILHDYQGMSHEEIAEVTGAGHSAVRKRYSRALSRLRANLEDVLNR